MNADNEKKLVEDFPVLFKDYGGHAFETAMAWGCECGDGWFDLIYQACVGVMQEDNRAYFTQIKEKFGGLRLYACANPKAYEVLTKAEKESYNICEICGSEENVTSEGSWIKTLCGVCRR